MAASGTRLTTSAILGLILALSTNAHAQAQAAGNVEAGRQKSEVCQGCHGADGNSYSPEWPNLAGQHPGYLGKQLRDFLAGTRVNELMSPMAAGLKEADIADITAFFAAQTVIPEAAEPPPAQGKRLYQGGNGYSKVPACASCHGPAAAGNAPGLIPALTGQKAVYTAQALRQFKSGARRNDRNQIMREIAARLTEGEIDAVAAYVAALTVTTAAR
jgi:cytochrome c553